MKTLFALATLLSMVAGAQSALPRAVDSLVLKGTHAALRHDYDEAERCFRHAATADRTHPAGLIFLAGLLYQKSEDLSLPFDHHSFDSLLTESEVRARMRESMAPPDPWIPVLRATARGMLAVEEAGSGEWMAAVRDALASSSEAQEAQLQDSSMADAGLPLGNYLYWKSRKTEALHWLPLFTDERAEGIRLLEECAQNGRYHRFAAISSLIWILHDAKDLVRAEAWARRGLVLYPDNRTYLAGLAMVHETKGEFVDAADGWARIASSLGTAGVGRVYSAFSASVNQLRCLLAAGDVRYSESLAGRISEPVVSQVPRPLHGRLKAKIVEWGVLKKRVSAMAASAAKSSDPR